jgi:hypothetical protein
LAALIPAATMTNAAKIINIYAALGGLFMMFIDYCP